MAARAVSLGGVGAALSAEDVLRVARGAPCELDVAVMTKLERDAAAPSAQKEPVASLCDAIASLKTAEPTTALLSAEATRAVVFVKAGELIRAKGPPRPAVLRFLAALLAKGVAPALPASETDADALSALADALCGSGFALQPSGGEAVPLAAALAAADLQPPGLTSSERAAVLAGAAPSVALAAVAVARARRLLPAAEAVSALSCEALQSNVSGFEAEAAEACPHKHEVAAAAELSALLEGSKFVNPRKGGETPVAVAASAQLHGRVRECLQAAGTCLRVELNATPNGVAASKAPPAPASAALASAAAGLLAALAAGIRGSAERAAACKAGDASAASADSLSSDAARVAALLIAGSRPSQATPALAVAFALYTALPRACEVLSAELSAAAALVGQVEAAKAGPPAAAAPAAGDGKAVDKKMRGAGAPTLGKGTALLRAFAASGGRVALDDAALEALMDDLRTLIEANAARRKPKIAKGTRDFLPEQMAIRERAFSTIVGVFKRHGAVALDTPVFELRETLMGKYGEDSKLIYELADQGGEMLALRYDLTVPFARYLAMHAVGNIKRYHIARVYRRDNPAMARGRFREFYQCDFDIAGTYPSMMADSEVLKVMSEILGSLDIGSFAIKINHRGLLDAALEVSGVPASKFRTICSAVDKLDKEPWEEVRREMVEDKGLSPEAADRVGTFVALRAPMGQPRELLAMLQGPDSPFGAHAGAAAALADLSTLFDYLEAMGAQEHFVLDMSLARGLDYYTGVIYEAVLTGGGTSAAVGSIGGGGRYDNLVGMFSGKPIPAVGLSVGIERIFNIMEERERAKNPVIRATQTEVLVASIGPNLVKHRMSIAARLWSAGLKAEYLFAASPNMQKQLTHALETGIPLMVIFGEDELAAGQVKLKRLSDHAEVTVPQDELVQRIRDMLLDGERASANVVVS